VLGPALGFGLLRRRVGGASVASFFVDGSVMVAAAVSALRFLGAEAEAGAAISGSGSDGTS
jgi:hypothetical protein